MKPNAQNYNPNPDYLRELIGKAGLTQTATAQLIGIDPRTMRRYLAFADSPNYQKAPYAVQFAIECLANNS
ncbi:MAG: helix-turn-helix transcriptional regulator [Moraxella sp.]|nr:helix-turn-helix transcriptional regulator [Moraxella sp.]